VLGVLASKVPRCGPFNTSETWRVTVTVPGWLGVAASSFSRSTTSPENMASEPDSACLACCCWLPPLPIQEQAEAQSGSKTKMLRARSASPVILASGRVNNILLAAVPLVGIVSFLSN
jgi:hypothetical protein